MFQEQRNESVVMKLGKRFRRRMFSRTFSLRSILVAVLLIGCGVALYSREFRLQQKINASITKMRSRGAIVFVLDSNTESSAGAVKPATLWSVLTFDRTIASSVEFANVENVRDLIPDVQIQIGGTPSRGTRYFFVDLKGNSNVSDMLVEEMKRRLPDCTFCRYPVVPTHVKDSIQVGMSKEQVVAIVGRLVLKDEANLTGDRHTAIQQAGSRTSAKYTRLGGQETWTYSTDDVGIGVVGIDFDTNERVTSIWSDRGITKDRALTEVFPVIGGLR